MAGSRIAGGSPGPENSRVDSLAAVLHRLTARIDSLESGHCPDTTSLALPAPSGNARTDSLLAVTAELDRRLRALRDQRCAAAAPAPAPAQADTTDELAALRAAAAEAAGGAAAARWHTGRYQAAPPPAPEPQAPRNASALNPEISATGDIRLVAREGRQRDNGVAREFEVALQSALDPVLQHQDLPDASRTRRWASRRATSTGPGCPGRLRVDVGKFRQQVGDLNRWHLHALPETEYPLVYQRFLAPEGLTGVGLSLYTALPVSLAGGTHEVWVQGTTAESDPLLRRRPRAQRCCSGCRTSGSSAAAPTPSSASPALGGNDDDGDLRSRLAGLDFRLTYRPPEAGTRREITFRAEGYRLHATEAGTTTNRYGTFLDLQRQAHPALGLRRPATTRSRRPAGPDDTEWRMTPSLTWWQSEFVYLRLEGEHRHSDLEGTQNLLTLQAVWAMGPHKHETY